MKCIKKMEAMNYKTPYYEWECFKNGMYKTYSEINDYDIQFKNSILLLSNQDLFYKIGLKVLKDWPISCDNFLTNKNINKIAFIGQVCCCYKFGCSEIVVKDAWKTLDSITQYHANKTALEILNLYERSNRRIQSKMEEIWV